jgi:hypothetical protein
MQFDLGDSEWRARWDNTLKYSMAYRLQGQDSAITDSPTAGATGRERKLSEFKALCVAAGFVFDRITENPAGQCVLEAVPA